MSAKKWRKQTNMDGKNYQKGFHVGRSSRGVKEKPWSHDELNVLQLDLFDRTVVKIAGEKCLNFVDLLWIYMLKFLKEYLDNFQVNCEDNES